MPRTVVRLTVGGKQTLSAGNPKTIFCLVQELGGSLERVDINTLGCKSLDTIGIDVVIKAKHPKTSIYSRKICCYIHKIC
jgi:hypothetical protein